MECMHIICNPKSEMGRGRRRLNEVTSYLESWGVDYQIYLTQYPGHMRELLTACLGQFKEEDSLILVGGDGSLHELVNLLADRGLDLPLAFVSAGTGNDFSRYYQAGKETIEDLLAPMFKGQVRRLRIGRIDPSLGKAGGVFVNSLGFGFDGQVIHESEGFKAKGGIWQVPWANRVRYLVSLFQSLRRVPNFALDVRLSGHSQHFSDVSLVAVMLNPYFGGGIQLDPRVAELEDDLALVVVHDLDWRAIPGLLYQILWRKGQGDSKHLASYRGPRCELNLTPAIPGQVDGEAIFSAARSVGCRLDQQAFYL